jgi:hypothetical protein
MFLIVWCLHMLVNCREKEEQLEREREGKPASSLAAEMPSRTSSAKDQPGAMASFPPDDRPMATNTTEVHVADWGNVSGGLSQSWATVVPQAEWEGGPGLQASIGASGSAPSRGSRAQTQMQAQVTHVLICNTPWSVFGRTSCMACGSYLLVSTFCGLRASLFTRDSSAFMHPCMHTRISDIPRIGAKITTCGAWFRVANMTSMLLHRHV